MSAADSLNSAQVHSNWGSPGYGPNPKENAQGLLFSNAHAVNKATMAANRTGDEIGHKGYSKNRLDQVRNAFPVEPYAPSQEASVAREAASTPQAGHEAKDAITTAHIHDVVARSTMPPEHIEALRGTTIRTSDMSEGGAGVFNRQSRRVDIHGPLLRQTGNPFGNDTLIHELGHAVDAAHSSEQLVSANPTPVPGTTTNVAPMTSPESAATSEGFADAYALRHGRGMAGKRVDHTGEEVPYENFSQRGWENYAGFSDDPEISPQNRAPSAYFEARATHGAAKQLSLFD